MTSLTKILTAGKQILIRHAIAIAFLFASWKILIRWYTFQNPRDYLLFLFLASSGFLLAAGPFLYHEIKLISGRRILACLPMLVLCFPWGEWLKLGTIFTRESWSEMLFFQGLYIYAAVSILRLFPALALNVRKIFQKFLELIARHRFLFWTPTIFLFILTGYIAFFIYRETPVVQDSSAHLFQAHVLGQFKTYAPAPPVPISFTGPLDLLIMKQEKWFGMYLPGFAAIMAPATWVKLEWLVSPLLAALTSIIWIFYAQRWHDKTTAVLIGLLFLLSPFLVVMSSTVMVFTPELFFASGVIYLSRLTLEKPRAVTLLGLSLVLAGGILVRSFSLIPFLLPVIVYVSWQAFKKQLFRIPIAIVSGFTLGVIGLLFYQWTTTGNPFLPAYRLEFPDLGWGFGEHFIGTHSWLKAIDNISNNLLGLNHWLGGWLSGSLLFIFVFLFTHKIQVWDKLLLAGCLFLMMFYLFFFFQDLFFGPRYYYVFTPVLLLFIARTFTENSTVSSFSGNLLAPFLILTVLLSVPRSLPSFVKRYNPSKTQAGQLKEEIQKTGDSKTLVFLDKNVGQNFVNWNDPFLKSPVILCRDLEGYNAEVRKHFPDHRPVWFRMNFRYEKGKITSGFQFTNEPDRNVSGTLSLFELAMALQAAREYPKRDFFDICYIDLFNAGESLENYEFLEKAENKPLKGGKYKRYFLKGVVHAGKMLLLPKIAYEEQGHNWSSVFDPAHFRNEFEQAKSAFTAAGDTGETIMGQITKVQRRIDRNDDKNLSDEEIHLYLVEKIKLLSSGGSL